MTRVLVTGAAGFIGRGLCPALKGAGHAVAAGLRNGSTAVGLDGVEVRRLGDIGGEARWGEALHGIEAVVHLAARAHVMAETAAEPSAEYRRINAEGTRRLAEAAVAAGVRRLVFLSTVKVNGEATAGTPFGEGDVPAPADAYALSKWEAEQALAQVAARTALEVVVLRPPLVYGRGVKGNFLALLKLCRRAPPLPLASVANRRSLIYLGNLVDSIVRAVAHPDAGGRTYLVRDGEDISTPDLIRRLAAGLGRPARLFPVPPAALRLAGRLAGRAAAIDRLLDSLVVDDRRIRGELAWTPPFTLAKGLAETAGWFAANPR